MQNVVNGISAITEIKNTLFFLADFQPKFAKIIKLAEKDIKEINSEFSIENPIKIDLSVSKRSMAYNKIKAEVKKFRNKIKEMEEK